MKILKARAVVSQEEQNELPEIRMARIEGQPKSVRENSVSDFKNDTDGQSLMVDSQIHDNLSKEEGRTTGDVFTREIIESLQADKDELGIDDEFIQQLIQLLQEGENSTEDMIEGDLT